MVSCLVFKSFSHFEFIYVHGVRVCSSFIDFQAAVQVSQQHLPKRLFSMYCSFLLCQILIDCRCLGFFLHSPVCSIGLPVCFVTSTTCLDDRGFIILPEVWESDAYCLVFVPQNCFGNSGSFVVPYKILDCLFQFCEKCHGSYDRHCTESLDCFGQYGHFYQVNFSNPGAWSIFPFLYIFFNFLD